MIAKKCGKKEQGDLEQKVQFKNSRTFFDNLIGNVRQFLECPENSISATNIF